MLFSPDGRTLATWGCENTVRLWDVQTGKERNASKAHRGHLHTLAFSPNSRLLATGGDGVFVRVWEARPGKVLCGLTVPEEGLFFRGFVDAIAFSPDGKVLACGGGTSTVRLFSLPDGKLHRVIQLGDLERASALSFTPDGRILLSANSLKTKIQFWDWRTGEEKRHLEAATVNGFALSRDGRLLVTAGGRREVSFSGDDPPSPETRLLGWVQFWNLATGKEIRRIEREGSLNESVALLTDGRRCSQSAATPSAGWRSRPGRSGSACRDTIQWLSLLTERLWQPATTTARSIS